MTKEEILQKAFVLKQQSEQVEQQLNFVNEQIAEMEQFVEKLRVLAESDEEEILAPLGRGVYVKSKREKDERLFVEAGAGTVVRKTPKEAREIVQEQMRKFQEARIHLTGQLQGYAQEFSKMVGEREEINSIFY